MLLLITYSGDSALDKNMLKKTSHLVFIFLLLWSLAGLTGAEKQNAGQRPAGESPFSAKASLVRYWKRQITNDLPKPRFFLNKASPLNALDLAAFSKVVFQDDDQKPSTYNFQVFCSRAKLLCVPDLSPSLQKHRSDVGFVNYSDQNFTNYGTERLGGVDSFKNYSTNQAPSDSFRSYSRGSIKHNDAFNNYDLDANVVNGIFNNYGKTATGGDGKFTNYQNAVNVPLLTFTSYSDDADGRTQGFRSYSDEANSGEQDFKSYAKNGNGAENDFATYSNDSNVIISSFSSYGKTGNGVKDTFTKYGFNNNVPQNNFSSYGDGGNEATEIFKSYSDQANVGADSFTSYAEDSNGGKANFVSYGRSVNQGPVKFKSYGESSKGQKVGFNTYGQNYDFNKYAKTGVTFANYLNETSSTAEILREIGKRVNRKWVEPGKFFRESMLNTGTVMPMPDIKDKMPERSFLPRIFASKLPFSSAKVDQLKKIFHANDEDSRMVHMITDALNECERAPSPGETKRCVGSGEDMIDFATLVLGPNIVVRTTENTQGSGGDIQIGSVRKINGGKITKSVSCHQTLFPCLLYYCHSVPKVRLYEADILDPSSKAQINHGVAICHVDTSSWSPGHGAFLALGSSPGKIEVCHWIFENDMTWATAD